MAGGSAKNEHPLWRFCVALYADPQVARTCLRLQDEHGLDVCLLLACLWYGLERRRALPLDRLRELRHRALPIAGWTARLRVLRRELERPARHDPAWRDLYEKTKATELDAEALELALLYDAVAPDPSGRMEPRVAAEASLFRYAEIAAAAGAEPLLHTLVSALPPGPVRPRRQTGEGGAH